MVDWQRRRDHMMPSTMRSCLDFDFVLHRKNESHVHEIEDLVTDHSIKINHLELKRERELGPLILKR